MDYILIPLLMIAGWLVGSLVNYLSDVLPRTRRLTAAVCPSCEKPLSLLDYILLRPCPACGARASIRRRVVQNLWALGLVALWFRPPAGLGFWLTIPVFAYLSAVFVMDVEHRVVMHPVSLFGAVAGALLGIFVLNGPISTLIGGAAGFGIMFGLYLLGFVFSKIMSRIRGEEVDEVALGFGDVNLAGVLGLMLGWPRIGVVLLFAILLGGAVSLFLVIGMALTKKYRPLTAIPYAPFLVIVAAVIFYMARAMA